MRNIFTRLWVVSLLLLVTATVSAQQLTELEVGAVYRFVNRGTGRALNAGDSDGAYYVNATTESATDIKQQWYVTKVGEHYVLRNLEYAKYLKGATTNKVAWSLTDYYTETSNKFNLATSSTTWNTLETVGWVDYGFMHDDSNGYNGGYRVVSWENEGANNSHWTVTKVEYTADALKTILDAHPTVAEIVEKRTANFVSLFNEGACYTPKYSSLAAAQATTEYQALETELQTLATNIYNKALTTDGWAEANANTEKEGWSSEYAKKFRVQMYEPYSIAGDITGFLRMNAHANNDNPTGVYMPEAGTVYVMVEGEIKEGATLRLHCAASNGRITDPTGAGYALTTGLNVINIPSVATGGDHLYICYNVDTYNPNGATVDEKFPHKLSEYPPLKIHIEGGSINGFYNACGDFLAGKTYDNVTYNEDLWNTITGASVDCDDDWNYMETRANLSVIPIVSHRQVLLFQLHEDNGQKGMKDLLPESINVPDKPYCYPGTTTWADYGMGCDTETGRINIFMESWDRIMYSELATLGLVSRDDMDKMNELYPRWNANGTRGEIYDFNGVGPDGQTYQEFCRGLDYSEYYNHHGVSLGTTSGYMAAGPHEAYYNNSTFGELMNLPNSSGNIWGPCHEIGHQFQDVFNIRGGTEVTNNVFSNAAIWYQGIATSRYNWGNLTTTLDSFNSGLSFIDYNIWSMTQMFYKLWLYYHLAGNNTQFYPRFFEMLRLDPLNAKGATATGTESMLKIYEKMCYAAGEDLTEFFRAHGFFVLLDNYPKGDYGTTIFTQTQEEVDAAIARVKNEGYKPNYAALLINDLEETATLRHDGETRRNHYDGTPKSEFGSVNDFIAGSATTGGAYEAVVNSDGTVTMTGEGGVGFLIFDENGNVISFSDKSTFALSDEAKEAIMTGSATIVSVGTDVNSEPVAAEIDLTAMQKTILGELIAKAKLITDKIDDTYTKVGYYKAAAVTELANVLEYAENVYAGTTGFEAAYDLLYAEYQKVLANTDAKITLDLSKKYIINNKSYTTRNIAVNAAETDVYQVFALENSTGTSAQWSFVESATAGRYYLKNADGYYCPSVVTGGIGGNATTDQAQAGTYTLKELEHGLWAIIGTNAPLHAAGSGQNYNVVGWTYESTASQWYITSTEADEEAASLSQLQAAIAKTEALLGEVLGTVTYTRGENIALQTTTEGDPYYIWTNAQEAGEGPIANLVDGATNNYFHTDWHAENVSSGDHYIAVDLGSGNTLPRFAFSHTTRNADTDHAKSVDVYGCDEKDGTYKYLGSASGMPQTGSTFWQFEGIMVSSHRYLRFNMHATRGYWHMAEFDIMPVTGYTPTVNDTYSSTVTVETVTAAMEALYNGKGVAFSMSPEKTDIDAKLQTLETAYEALYTQYTATITARKNTLAELAASTDELIKKVGGVEITATVETALQTTNPTGDFYVSTNAQSSQEGPIAKLVDGIINQDSYFHTDYSGTNSTDGLDHYINISLGSSNATNKFKFSYANRTNASANFASAMSIYGSTDGATYELITQITSGLPASANSTYNSDVIDCAKDYTYLRFMVTANSSNELKGGHAFFHMAEFDLTIVGSTTVTVNDSYNDVISEELLLSSYLTTVSSTTMSTNALVTSVPMLDAQIADQQAVYDKLNAIIGNTAALKESLLELINNTQTLYNEMAAGDGTVNDYYSTSTLTDENLSETLAKITVATEVYNDPSAIAGDIKTAYDELNEKYTLLKGIKELDVAKDDLNTLIAAMEGLLEQTTTGVTEVGSMPLQIDDESAPYYIWSNSPASDCNNYDNKVQGLIDVHADGSANTGTFFGTSWSSHVDAYTHYIEIDLGVDNVVLEGLSIDYTTRESGAADSRPNGLKFYGSSDKNTYEEFHSVTTGLPADANTKWSMETPIELAKSYRYIRIAVSSPHGSCFNMSDFNLYSHCIATVNEFYSTSNIFACLPAVLREYCDAKEAAAKYLIEADEETAKNELQAQIDALNELINAHVPDRTPLSELAEETKGVVDEVATILESETAIKMQCDNENAEYYLYCNAEGKDNGGDDAIGVAALVGDNATNDKHLHTAYKGSTDDDLDHYLRLDMGDNEAMVSFKFSYTGRKSGNNNDPTEMLIEGSNDLENFELITKLTELPTSPTPTTYTSEELGNGKAYRYIRFMVTATNNGAEHNEHPFFVLSRFAVTACKTIEVNDDYVSPNLPLSTLVAANNEVVDANAVVNSTTYVSSDAYETALKELQAAKDALVLAQNLKNLPVILTTDANNPVLYKIKIDRDGNKLLQFDNAEKKVAVVDETFGNEYQAWYFMQGSVDNDYDDILIMPFWNGDAANSALRLGAQSTGDAVGAVMAVAKDNETHTLQNWYITSESSNDGWWNIRPETKDNYFSNNRGVNYKMGFWNSSSDRGSNFRFILDETDYSLSDAYFALYNNYLSYSKLEGSDKIGCFSGTSVSEFKAKLDEIEEMLEAKSSTDDEYTASNASLDEAYNALKCNMPVAGGFYKIRSAHTGYSSNALVFADDVNTMQWDTQSENSSRAIWYFEPTDDGAGFYIKNMHNDAYVQSLTESVTGTLSSATAKYTITVLNGATGVLNINSEGEPMHAREYNTDVVGYAGGEDSASAWFIEEVSENEMEEIGQSITLNTAAGEDKSYSTLYSAYPVTLPDGVDASIITERADNGLLTMQTITSESNRVVPAKTAVILSQSKSDASSAESVAGEVKFSAAESAVAIAEGDNMLQGTLTTEYIACGVDCADWKVYTLGRKSNKVAMYWAYANYDENGNRVTFEGTTGHDKGGYVKMGANKAYLKVGGGTPASAISMYSFWFGGETTGIGGVDADTVADGIYDLQGRKIEEVTAPGFYIVNGKKVYISDVE